MLYYERALAVDRLDRAGRMQDMSLAVGGGKKAKRQREQCQHYGE